LLFKSMPTVEEQLADHERRLRVLEGAAPVEPPALPAGSHRLYSADSPWNTPVPAGARVRSLLGCTDYDKRLSSDPTQYTYPLFRVPDATPMSTVIVSGRYSEVRGGRLTQRKGSISVPLPLNFAASGGNDAQAVILHKGLEFGFYELRKSGSQWYATNGYSCKTSSSAVMPSGFISRGAGMPYAAGLVTRADVDAGRIEHALAFGYRGPTSKWIYPASKSDGKSANARDLPEGARLVLSPDFDLRKLTPMQQMIGEALRQYGMYLVDYSGRWKIYVEGELTAKWGVAITSRTAEAFPVAAFGVVEN
jgi:hypothetical protein